MRARQPERARARPARQPPGRAARPIPSSTPTGLAGKLLHLQQTAGNAAVAPHLAALAAARRPESPAPEGDLVVQRVPLTKTDEEYIGNLKKVSKKAAKLAKERIKGFGTEEAAAWHLITTWPPSSNVPPQEKARFLLDLYTRLGNGVALDELPRLRRAFDQHYASPSKETPPLTNAPRGQAENAPGQMENQMEKKLLRQGGVKLFDIKPGAIKLLDVKPVVTKPKPVEQPKPAPQLGQGVLGQVADLLSLDLDAMWRTWKPSLAPLFDDHVKDHLVGDVYLVKVSYLALKRNVDPRDVEELAPEEASAQLGEDPRRVDLVQLVESGDPGVNVLSGYLSERFDAQALTEAFQQWKSSQLLYHAFAWSGAKHGGAGPTAVKPTAGVETFTWLKQGSSASLRVYCNTEGSATQTVATELHQGWDGQPGLPSEAYEGLEYAGAAAAADRRDAIVIYVNDLNAVLTAIARYQQAPNRRARFVDERVRLTRPAHSGVGALRGVGVADHPESDQSFSQLASGAVLKAREGAKGSQQKLQRLLAAALAEAGLNPEDPSRLLKT
jgi:hypothetical protein